MITIRDLSNAFCMKLPLKKQEQQTSERGIALLITLLVMTVLLGISSSLLNVTLKQFQFSAIGLQSEIAFQAANAGMECILYHDYLLFTMNMSRFDVNDDGTGVPPESNVPCVGTDADDEVGGNGSFTSLVNNLPGEVESGEEQRFEFDWPNTYMCSEVSIYKFSDADDDQSMLGALGRAGTCTAGTVCTVIRSRGYNVSCGDIANPRTIERELTQRY